MTTTDGTTTFSVVPAPLVDPPVVGLIASLGPPGGKWLDPPDTFPEFTLPALERGGTGETAPPTLPQRFEGGIQYLPENWCTSASAQDPCSTDLTDVPDSAAVVKANAFLVWSGFECSPFGWQGYDWQGRAIRALIASESKQIAAEVWKGTQATAAGWPNPILASPASDTLTNGPVSPTTALDCLEQGIATCGNGARGMIHCTPQLGSFWSGLGNTLRSVDGLILTYRGTIICPDAGYDGSGPNGQPAVDGSQWAYGTLIPQVRRSPIEVTPDSFEEATLRSTNLVDFRAWRTAVVTWPLCCNVNVEVSLPLCLSGGAS